MISSNDSNDSSGSNDQMTVGPAHSDITESNKYQLNAQNTKLIVKANQAKRIKYTRKNNKTEPGKGTREQRGRGERDQRKGPREPQSM